MSFANNIPEIAMKCLEKTHEEKVFAIYTPLNNVLVKLATMKLYRDGNTHREEADFVMEDDAYDTNPYVIQACYSILIDTTVEQARDMIRNRGMVPLY